jgi:DNA-binding LytR/AlgR family response regulator
MFIKSEYKLLRVHLDDILYVEGLKDYVRICLKNGEKIMSLMSMKKLEDYLPRPEFLRTHRSYIVHMPEVRSIDRFRIVFGDIFIPISDNYKEEVQQYLDTHTLS